MIAVARIYMRDFSALGSVYALKNVKILKYLSCVRSGKATLLGSYGVFTIAGRYADRHGVLTASHSQDTAITSADVTALSWRRVMASWHKLDRPCQNTKILNFTLLSSFNTHVQCLLLALKAVHLSKIQETHLRNSLSTFSSIFTNIT